MRKSTAVIIIAILYTCLGCQNAPSGPLLHDGDIIFQTYPSSQSEAIKLATGSKYSHVGIIYFDKGEPFVFEAVQPVGMAPLAKWVNRNDAGHYVVKRLKNADMVLTPEALNEMKEIGREMMGRNYDIYFGWGDDRLYCSELVWKVYQRATGIEIGKLRHLSDFDLTHPAVAKVVQERYGDTVPLDEPVISPEDLFQSELLQTVVEK